MTRPAYVDSTVLIALGAAGELDLLQYVPGSPAVLPAVRDEIRANPEAQNVERFCDQTGAAISAPSAAAIRSARDLLGRPAESAGDWDGDVAVLAAVLDLSDDREVIVCSDDRTVRATADGLGATVTGTLGVLVHAVESGHDPDAARSLLDRIEEQGFHTTADLRQQVERLIGDAADRYSDQ